MKKNTFIFFRGVAGLLAFVYFFGLLWFCDYYSRESSVSIIFMGSSGVAFLFLPLIRDSWLRLYFIRGMGIVIGTMGFINLVRMLVKEPVNEVLWVSLVILILMLLRFINPGFIRNDDKSKTS